MYIMDGKFEFISVSNARLRCLNRMKIHDQVVLEYTDVMKKTVHMVWVLFSV